MTYSLTDLDRALPDASPELRAALVQQLRDDGLLAQSDAPNTTITASADPYDLDNLLKDMENDVDPHPGPPGLQPGDGPGPNLPGVKGCSGIDGTWQLPTDAQYIDEHGFLRDRASWRPPVRKRKTRKLAPLDDSLGIQRELTRTYADFHHGHLNSVDFSRRVYALTALSNMQNQDRKAAVEYTQKILDPMRKA